MENDKRKMKYCCKECGYKSVRRFNVERHRQRIHSKSIIKKCCNIVFLKKSDFYHHVEDVHPSMRSSCLVSRDKYKIYGRRKKLLSTFRNKTNVKNMVNDSNISDKCTSIRKSARIRKRVSTARKIATVDLPSELECNECDDNDMDIDYCNFNESEEVTHDLHNYKPMNSFSSVSLESENSRTEESENNNDSRNDCYLQSLENDNFNDYQYIQEQCINNFQNNINLSRPFRHQEFNLDPITDKNVPQLLSADTKENIQERINSMFQLPLKKRILCEINNNTDKSFIIKNDVKKMSFEDKENEYPINIYLREYQDATIVKRKLTSDTATQMWNNITQCQRDFLQCIDFNSF